MKQKTFWIKVKEWIKNLFLGIKVLKKEDYYKAIDYCDSKGKDFFDWIDDNKDGIITISEIIKKIKQIKK